METKVFEDRAFIYVDTPHLKGWHRCAKDEFFACHDPYDGDLDKKGLKWVNQKLPADITGNILALAARYPHTEVMVALYYNFTENKWHAHVPKQYGTAAHVYYTDEDYTAPQGYFFYGTVHTHPNMGAFWSGTDTNDQKNKPGVHTVLGLREGAIETWKTSIVYNGVHYDQTEQLFDIPEILPEAPPQDWLDRVAIEWRPPCLEQLHIRKGSDSCDGFSGFISGTTYPKQDDFWSGRHYAEEEAFDDITPEEASVYLEECMPPQQLYKLIEYLLEDIGEVELAERVSAKAVEAELSSDSDTFGLSGEDFEYV